jgi:hypothetical protein
MKKTLVAILIALALVAVPTAALAASSADVTVTATPTFVSISASPGSFDFGAVSEGDTPSSTTSYFTVTNNSSVATDNTVSVTSATWTGGVAWNHSDTGTAGADTAALLANKGGAWGVGDVIVKNSAPNVLAASQASKTNWGFGLKLLAPTSFSDDVQKTNTVRITASQHH